MVLKDIPKASGTGPTKQNCGATASVWSVGEGSAEVSRVSWFLAWTDLESRLRQQLT